MILGKEVDAIRVDSKEPFILNESLIFSHPDDEGYRILTYLKGGDSKRVKIEGSYGTNNSVSEASLGEIICPDEVRKGVCVGIIIEAIHVMPVNNIHIAA